MSALLLEWDSNIIRSLPIVTAQLILTQVGSDKVVGWPPPLPPHKLLKPLQPLNMYIILGIINNYV